MSAGVSTKKVIDTVRLEDETYPAESSNGVY